MPLKELILLIARSTVMRIDQSKHVFVLLTDDGRWLGLTSEEDTSVRVHEVVVSDVKIGGTLTPLELGEAVFHGAL